MMRAVFDEKKYCCGCSACFSVCPKNAIAMQEDTEGFVFPQINQKLCVECGLCRKICNFQNRIAYSVDHQAYAAVTKDKFLLMKSSSGGIFATLAKEFIKSGGYVSGAVYDQKFRVQHIVSNSISDIYRMQGSKYVQSMSGTVFSQVRELLDAGEHVMFSGTPCQVDGLYGFLQKDYENLYTIDIVCHGVPSNQLFQKYLEFEEKKHGKIEVIKFRDKQYGWGTNGIIKFKNYKKKINSASSEYYYLFNEGSVFRDACYSCKYAGLDRPADITLGDYWGIEKTDFELLKTNHLDEKKGISLILSNSLKGSKLLELCQESICLYQSTPEKVSKYNHNLNVPSKMPENRSDTLEIANQSFDKISKIISGKMKKKKLSNLIKNIVPSKLKLLIKRKCK